MFRLLYFVLFLIVTLAGSLPALRKSKKVNKELTVAERDQQVHQLPKRWARAVMKSTGSSVHIQGQEHIPNGPVLFICNHEGDFDIPALLGHVDKPFGFISKVEVKKVPVVRDWMDIIGCIYINRNNRRDAVKMLRDGAEKLKAGHSLLIFPEGTRSLGGEMKPFKSGGFRIAKDANVPIVPVAIKGTSDMFEKNNRKKVTSGHLQIEILPAIPFTIFEEYELKDVADLTQQKIQKALDQMNK
ncbi:lysophospholipid acyltransferase family protein [Bacillus sp. FJAT-52991]|uniref:1-acyl-sn-glycerol-3-phosphate acyltransferase n=1 Tax=Bacillus kandeliae TaxID=3129297 RepID=A0ABZ2N2K8_9BACI